MACRSIWSISTGRVSLVAGCWIVRRNMAGIIAWGQTGEWYLNSRLKIEFSLVGNGEMLTFYFFEQRHGMIRISPPLGEGLLTYSVWKK